MGLVEGRACHAGRGGGATAEGGTGRAGRGRGRGGGRRADATPARRQDQVIPEFSRQIRAGSGSPVTVTAVNGSRFQSVR